MSLHFDLLIDPLFLPPFLLGLAQALLLPLVGLYLRLRDEWIVAFALAQVASAGALLGLLAGLPLALGGVAGAGFAVLVKSRFGRAGAPGYVLLLLLGWAVSVLVVANAPVAERLGHALLDGQLYFADREQLWLAAAWLPLALAGLRRLSAALLRERLFPANFRAAHGSGWRIHLGFDLLAAVSVALATMSVGVMAAFALAFLPAWSAFARSRSWRHALLRVVGLGLGSYLLAFATAIVLDQPFGAVCALLTAVVCGLARRPRTMRP